MEMPPKILHGNTRNKTQNKKGNSFHQKQKIRRSDFFDQTGRKKPNNSQSQQKLEKICCTENVSFPDTGTAQMLEISYRRVVTCDNKARLGFNKQQKPKSSTFALSSYKMATKVQFFPNKAHTQRE